MSLYVDLRDSDWTPATVPESAWVPLAQAHTLVLGDLGKSTVYRWYAKGWLDGLEVGPVPGSPVLYVQVIQVRSVYRRVRARRHARRKVPIE